MDETEFPKTCPICGVAGPVAAERCNCGYDYTGVNDTFVQSCLTKLQLLESRVGAGVVYETLEPAAFPPPGQSYGAVDERFLGDATRTIARFIGVAYFNFEVTIRPQKENVGGHIDFHRYEDSNRRAFIEVSHEVAEVRNSTLATLAHEVTHAYLHVYKISCGTAPYDDEVLTDVAAVFLGLGKLMLNGIEYQRSWNSGDRTTTRTLRCGYLSREQFVFLYWFVCAMRRIPESVYQNGLQPEIITEIIECDSQWRQRLIEIGSHEKASTLDVTFKDQVHQLGAALSVLERCLILLQQTCINTTERLLDETHRWIKTSADSVHSRMNSGEEYDPAMKVLKNAVLRLELHKLMVDVKQRFVVTSRAQEGFEKIASCLIGSESPYQDPDPVVFRVQHCRICNTPLKLREDGGPHQVRCPNPKCKYVFVASSAPLTLKSATAKNAGSLRKALSSWFSA